MGQGLALLGTASGANQGLQELLQRRLQEEQVRAQQANAEAQLQQGQQRIRVSQQNANQQGEYYKALIEQGNRPLAPKEPAAPRLQIVDGQVVNLGEATARPISGFQAPETPTATPAPVNWVTDLDRGVQVHPRTGQVRPLSGVPDKPTPAVRPTARANPLAPLGRELGEEQYRKQTEDQRSWLARLFGIGDSTAVPPDKAMQNIQQDFGPLLNPIGPPTFNGAPVDDSGLDNTTVRARDPQGNLHEAPAGTPLPPGWVLEQ